MVDSGLDRESWHWGRFRPPKRSIFVSNGFIWWARVTITCSFTLETPKKIDLTLGRFLVLGFIGSLCFWRLLIGLPRFLWCFLGVLSQKKITLFFRPHQWSDSGISRWCVICFFSKKLEPMTRRPPH
jgi:hypothetical protein